MDATSQISPEELEELREAFTKIGERTKSVTVISSLFLTEGGAARARGGRFITNVCSSPKSTVSYPIV